MDPLSDCVWHRIYHYAGYPLNIAMVNRRTHHLMKAHIQPIRLAHQRWSVEFLEWAFSILGTQLFLKDFEYAHDERLIVFCHEHNPNSVNMALVTAQRGYYEQTRWCLEHGFQWHPDIRPIAIQSQRLDLLHFENDTDVLQ